MFTENPNDPALTDPWAIRAWYMAGALFLIGAAISVYNAPTALDLLARVFGAALGSLFFSVGLWKLGGLIRN